MKLHSDQKRKPKVLPKPTDFFGLKSAFSEDYVNKLYDHKVSKNREDHLKEYREHNTGDNYKRSAKERLDRRLEEELAKVDYYYRTGQGEAPKYGSVEELRAAIRNDEAARRRLERAQEYKRALRYATEDARNTINPERQKQLLRVSKNRAILGSVLAGISGLGIGVLGSKLLKNKGQ